MSTITESSNATVDDLYRTLPFPFAELEPPAFSHRADWTLADLDGYLGTWSALRRYRQARGEDPRRLVAADLARAWGDPAAARPVAWRLGLRVGRVGSG